jgi:hypothetical protein
MPINKYLLGKARHQSREDRLALHYHAIGGKEDTYTVFNHDDLIVDMGVTMKEYINKGYHVERYTLVKK